MKLLSFTLLFLTSIQAFAICHDTHTVFTKEGNDDGIVLDLIYTCDADGEEICLYSNSDIGAVTGSLRGNYISTTEFYRRKYKVTGNKLRILAMTSIWESFFNHQQVEVNIDVETLAGDISITGDGVDPHSKKVKSTLNAELVCQ